MQNYKYLVLADLDGTLLNSEGLLSKNTVDAVLELNKRDDILFSFSTGRAGEDCRNIYEQLQLKGFVSCCNSAFIYDPHKDYPHISLLSPHVGQGILNSPVMLERLVNGKLLSGNTVVDFDSKNASSVAEKVQQEKGKVYGVKMYFDHSKLTPEVKQNVSDKISFIKTFESRPYLSIFYYPGLLNLEVQANYVNKERAVDFLGNYYNIKPENILTFGDNHNDLSVMVGKSNSYAVANAIDMIKQSSKNLSKFTNDQDSVVREIEIFLKNKENCCS